jgi:hypothetical protein
MTATRPLVLLMLAFGVFSATLAASGRVGLYGIVEKVVFEPSEAAPERVQVWGAFAYSDGTGASRGIASAARRGYVYFKLPTEGPSSRDAAIAEWKDLKSVAGTGQAVAFGAWGYLGTFQALDPGSKTQTAVFEMIPGRREPADLRVRAAAEPPASPTPYTTNAGVVKLGADGSRADVVRSLREALAAR